MLTEDKVIEIFVMADEFCKIFNTMLRRRGLDKPQNGKKRDYHSNCRMSQAEIIIIMIMFHSSNQVFVGEVYRNQLRRQHVVEGLPQSAYSYAQGIQRNSTTRQMFPRLVLLLQAAPDTQRQGRNPEFHMKGGLRPMYDRILLRKRAIIETINDELKNIAQIEHSRHRSFPNFIVNLIGGIAAYCLFPKKPMMNLERVYDNQLTLF